MAFSSGVVILGNNIINTQEGTRDNGLGGGEEENLIGEYWLKPNTKSILLSRN